MFPERVRAMISMRRHARVQRQRRRFKRSRWRVSGVVRHVHDLCAVARPARCARSAWSHVEELMTGQCLSRHSPEASSHGRLLRNVVQTFSTTKRNGRRCRQLERASKGDTSLLENGPASPS